MFHVCKGGLDFFPLIAVRLDRESENIKNFLSSEFLIISSSIIMTYSSAI